MKKIIPALLLSIMFFQAVCAQEDEGIGGVSPKKVKFKPLQTGRLITAAEPQVLQGKAYGVNIIKDTTKRPIKIFIRCGVTRPEKPLYVIDDVPFPGIDLRSIDANSIISIDIMKGPKATAIYGSSGAAGVVLIYTKQKTLRVCIKDSLHNEPLPHATLELLFKDNRRKRMIAADSAGYCLVDKALLSGVSSMNISYTGYIPRSIKSSAISFEKDPVIRLVPEKDMLKVITLECYPHHKERNPAVCVSIVTAEQIMKKKASAPVQIIPAASVFPNPISRGNELQVKFNRADAGRLSIVLSSIQGLPVYQASIPASKKQDRFSIQMPQNIPAGIYLLTANNTTGQLVVQQRIVVE